MISCCDLITGVRHAPAAPRSLRPLSYMNRIAPCVLVLSLLVTACDDVDTAPMAPSLVASRVSPLTAYPAGVLRTGSSVSVAARVTDASGTNIVGGVVTWRTTAGALSSTSTTTDVAGITSVTLTGREAATVTATIAGLPEMSIDVPAVNPFHVALQVQTTNPTTTTPVSLAITTPTTREVPGAPSPTSVLVECGNGDQVTPGPGGVVSCRYPEAGRYVATGRASANGFTTDATASFVVVAPPPPPAPPAPPPVVPGLALTATELHRSTSSATWRFRVTAVGGERIGNLEWFLDYISAPPGNPATLVDDEDFVDVTYLARGTKEVTVTGNVGGTTVRASVTIVVAF
jgi:hypothetical protein